MDVCKTPVNNKNLKRVKKIIEIPPSPLMQKLGYGTGVAVYKMNRSPVQNELRSPWALKKPTRRHKNTTEINQRIREEANLLRKLTHPNVIGFRAHIKLKDGGSALAMEQCTTSLGDLIESRAESNEAMFSHTKILAVAKDVANAMSYLHSEALILHCDVKSYNVLIKGDFDVCKLCDFGVYLPLTPEGRVDLIKVPEPEYVGTLPWCPPEILSGDQIITDKADIYAYGITIWEMLAISIPPVPENNDDSLIEEAVVRQRPDLPDVDFGEEYNFVLGLFCACTEVDYKKRPKAKDLITIF